MEKTTQPDNTQMDIKKLKEAITSLTEARDGKKALLAGYARKKFAEISTRELDPESREVLEKLDKILKKHGRTEQYNSHAGKIISEERNRGWAKA